VPLHSTESPTGEATSFRVAMEREATALPRSGTRSLRLRVAGRTVDVRCTGDGLARALLPALVGTTPCPGPRRSAAPAGRATIRVWEAPLDHVPIPWRLDALGPGGLVREPPDCGPVRAVHDTAQGAVTLASDGDGATVLHRVADHRALPWWERAAPLKAALQWALTGSGGHLVHAAAVADDRGAVLIVGPRGTGKTTAVMAARKSGLGLIADDYLVLETTGPIVAHALYRTICVRNAADLDAAKTVLDAGPPRWTAPTVRAIVLPVAGSRSLSPVSPARMLRAWAPTTALGLPSGEGSVLPALARAVRALPCVALDPASDAAGALGALLEDAR
jgi:hypothetical protein